MSSVGQYSTNNSVLSIRSFTKKYLMLICLVLLPLEAFPVFSNLIALWLSWNSLFSTSYPCSIKNILSIISVACNHQLPPVLPLLSSWYLTSALLVLHTSFLSPYSWILQCDSSYLDGLHMMHLLKLQTGLIMTHTISVMSVVNEGHWSNRSNL